MPVRSDDIRQILRASAGQEADQGVGPVERHEVTAVVEDLAETPLGLSLDAPLAGLRARAEANMPAIRAARRRSGEPA